MTRGSRSIKNNPTWAAKHAGRNTKLGGRDMMDVLFLIAQYPDGIPLTEMWEEAFPALYGRGVAKGKNRTNLIGRLVSRGFIKKEKVGRCFILTYIKGLEEL